MASTHLFAAWIMILLSASAAEAAEVSLSGGGAVGIPTGPGRVTGGPGAAADLRFAVDGDGHHCLGALLRGYLVGFDSSSGFPPDTGAFNVAVSYRWVLGDDGVRPFLSAAAGVGAWLPCIYGDMCGGGGPIVSSGIGVRYGHLEVLAEALVQTGMGNGVGELLVPTFWAGGAF